MGSKPASNTRNAWLGIFLGIILFIVLAIIIIAVLIPKIDPFVETKLNDSLIGEINTFSPGIPQNAYVCTLRYGGIL